MAKKLHHEPSGISAGTTGAAEGLFGRLHAGFHADEVANIFEQSLINLHQKINGAHA